MRVRPWESICGDTFSRRSSFSSSFLSSLVPSAFYSRFHHSVTLYLDISSVHPLQLHQYQQCQLPHPRPTLIKPVSVVILIVGHAFLPTVSSLRFHSTWSLIVMRQRAHQGPLDPPHTSSSNTQSVLVVMTLMCLATEIIGSLRGLRNLMRRCRYSRTAKILPDSDSE